MERNQENHGLFEAEISSYARFDTIDFSKEITGQRMALNVNKNVDEC